MRTSLRRSLSPAAALIAGSLLFVSAQPAFAYLTPEQVFGNVGSNASASTVPIYTSSTPLIPTLPAGSVLSSEPLGRGNPSIFDETYADVGIPQDSVLHSGAPQVTPSGPQSPLALGAIVLASLCTLAYSWYRVWRIG